MTQKSHSLGGGAASGEAEAATADKAAQIPEAETDEVSAPPAPPSPPEQAPAEGSPAGAEAPAAGEDAGPQPALEGEPAPADDEAAKYLELAKRTQADFDNFRKRMARENAAAAQRGAAKLAKELLPALDHLELALKATEGGHADVVKGFALVHDELIAALARVGIQRFSPQGEAFDPNEHEAMAQHPSEDAESGTVIEVYQQGYRHNGTVLRPARVVVAQ